MLMVPRELSKSELNLFCTHCQTPQNYILDRVKILFFFFFLACLGVPFLALIGYCLVFVLSTGTELKPNPYERSSVSSWKIPVTFVWECLWTSLKQTRMTGLKCVAWRPVLNPVDALFLKNARSRNFRYFHYWLTGHNSKHNIKIMT